MSTFENIDAPNPFAINIKILKHFKYFKKNLVYGKGGVGKSINKISNRKWKQINS